MKLSILFNTAINNLLSNKIRAVLTMLGVIIGVFSVIILVAIGSGIESYITQQFNSLGSNLIFVTPGVFEFNDDPSKAYSRNKLDKKHLELIDQNASDVVLAASPSIRLADTVKYKTIEYNASVIGGNEDVPKIFNYELAEGTFFNANNVRSHAKVAVLGDAVRKELFGTQNPIDKTINMGDEVITIIGYISPKSSELDQAILMPYTTAQDIYGTKNFSSIAVKLKDDVDVNTAMRKVELSLMRDLKEDEFSVMSQSDILSSIQNILRVLTAGIGAIAGIFLVVGGIGIMNIMLVSVNERIREIGLRKALGATTKNIALQFLFESIIISLLGGVIGLSLGWLGSIVAKNFITTNVPIWAVIMALSFSILVGVIFGTYPAVQAGKKNPIDALRYE